MQSTIDNKDERAESFKVLTECFAALVHAEGMPLTAFRGKRPEEFDKLPQAAQELVLHSFRRYVEVCNGIVESGASLAQDGLFLWRMFRKLGVHPTSDLMSTIEDGDVIEIYNTDFVQVFRNLGFFARCSYTLDELLCRPFWQLFRRDEKVTENLVTVGSAIISQRLKGLHTWDTGVHTVEEIDSPARYRSVVENRILCPLFDANGRVVAAVNTIRSHSCVRQTA